MAVIRVLVTGRELKDKAVRAWRFATTPTRPGLDPFFRYQHTLFASAMLIICAATIGHRVIHLLWAGIELETIPDLASQGAIAGVCALCYLLARAGRGNLASGLLLTASLGTFPLFIRYSPQPLEAYHLAWMALPILFAGMVFPTLGILLYSAVAVPLAMVFGVAGGVPSQELTHFAVPFLFATTCMVVLTGVAQDKMERWRQQQLAEATRRYEILLATTHEGIALLEEGRFIEANVGFGELFGIPADEVRGRELLDFLEHDPDETTLEGGPWSLKGLRSDGSTFDAEVASNRRSQGGRTVRAVAVRDITMRVQEEAHRRMLAAAAEQAAEAMAVTGLGGRTLWANPAYDQLIGRALEIDQDALGRLAGGCNDPSLLDGIRSAMRAGRPWSGRLRTSRTEQETAELDVSVSPIRDLVGRVTSHVWVISDVSDKVELESLLRQSQKMEAVGTLAGGIAHDFNNVLSAIIGYTEMVAEDIEQGSQAQDDLQQVLRASTRAKDLIGQILTFSRRTESAREPVRLCQVVEETFGLLRASIPSTVEMYVAPGPSDGFVLADPVQLEQLVLNLCTNSADAMRGQSGSIRISVGDVEVGPEAAEEWAELSAGEYLELAVADDGPGIPAPIRKRIFEPFYTTKAPGKGTGLGLSVVHGIVTGHGGAIRVHSSVGQGTTFRILLPRAQMAPQLVRTEPVRESNGAGRVLFVDDEEVLARLGQRLLTSLGYEVESFTDSSAALASFREEPARYVAVVTDQTMPHLTGTDLAARIHELRPGIPVVLCSGRPDELTSAADEIPCIRAVVAKPYARALMAETLKAAVGE